MEDLMQSTPTCVEGVSYFTPFRKQKRGQRGQSDDGEDSTCSDGEHMESAKRLKPDEMAVIMTQLSEANECIRKKDARIAELEMELTTAKIAFANATINQFSSLSVATNQALSLDETSGPSTHPSYAQVAGIQPTPVLVASLSDPPADDCRVTLDQMEQLLNSNSGGPVPASVRHRNGTVIVRLSDPADLDRAKLLLESRKGPTNDKLFTSVKKPTKLYPAVALFVDLALLPSLKEELMRRNVKF